ncbi:transcription initiation factor TFIID subunit 11 [Phytophthora boehmeriae]|uniref:Transcription initiation factor TFIID subunit 11 n=1 Tax=Phytophthora boehmeriae TaxID=109152 RepID=A0A8T1X0P4_9STRA|nr:transcription initiation factor TFIID subunit 11 [Phytophthora boehmeriae]
MDVDSGAASRAPMGLSVGTSSDKTQENPLTAGDAPTHAEDEEMDRQSASQGTEDEDESKSLAARHGDVTTDDDPQESTADEEEDEEDEEEVDSDVNEDKVELSDSASMLRMMQSLPEDEARRHEQFRRSHFERGAVKRCMAQAIQECSAADRRAPSVTNVMAIVMAGMTKVFVGEITAEARKIMEKNGETGPIRPRHLREAHRKYYKRRPLARGRNMCRLFR